MRRAFALATLLPLLMFSPLWAQHGGGHASAGGHSSFGGHSGFSGHSSFSSGGVHSGSSAASRSYGHTYAYSGPLSSSSRGFNRGFNSGIGTRIRPYGYRNCYGYGFGCGLGYGYGYGYGYPYLYGGIDPYWWGDNGYSFDYEQQYETGLANEMNQQSLQEQQMRRQQEQEDDREYYDQNTYATAPRPPMRPAQSSQSSEALPATVLVFRDQHKEEVTNYAIVGQTLWSFSAQRAQKIPLSDLDLPATTKANDERGVDFHMPGSPEGQ